jgi:hypothetical protein
MRQAFKVLSPLGPWLVAASVLAQQGAAELRGRIHDPQGQVLPGVTLVLRNQDTGMYREATSGSEGTYFFSGVTPGEYELTADLQGFKKTSRRGLRLEIGKTMTFDVQLDVGSREEEVTVTAEAPLVDVTSKEVGANITSRELVDLPSINRNYIGLIGVIPGVIPNISTESFGSDSINVNGQDARNNNYMLDGANNNDDVIGQRAGTQARTPLEAIQEFQVLTSQFDAEFGRTAGAVINAVTKQGTNALHGSAFGFFQDASLTEKDYFAEKNNLNKPDTRTQQYGFTVGGPVVRDKAHFFVSVERVLNDRGTTINIPSRPELNATATTADRVWNTLARFDHQISPRHTWNLRWLRESSPQRNQIIPVVVGTTTLIPTLNSTREENDVDQTFAASLNSTLGSTRNNTLRVAFTQEDVAFANPGFNGNGRDQAALAPSLNFLSYTDQQSNVAQARVNNAWLFEDTFSWYLSGKGDHNIRAGVQYEYVTVDFTDQGNLNGTFTFRSDQPFNSADPRTYPERLQIRVPSALAYLQKEHFFGAFIQDKWKIGQRLTLSLGLRYDLERIPIQQVDNPRFADPGDYPVDGNNFSPRLGFAYDLGGDGRSVIRGGYGRFYDKTHFELISNILTAGVFSNSFIANFPANAADPGPSRGQIPTDPLLRNGPTVDRAQVAALFPAGSRIRNTGNVFLDVPDRRVPHTDQLSLGFERSLGRDLSVSADYVHGIGRDYFMTQDLNPGVRVDTSRTGRIARVDPNFVSSVFARVNTGETDYDAIMLQLEKRWSRSYRFRAAYTLSSSRGNTPGDGVPTIQFQYLDDLRLDQNEGPTAFDRRHNFVFSGSAQVPRTGLMVSALVRALSGLPFTIQDTNTDPDQNGLLFDPIAAGSYSGSGSDSFTVDNQGGRNGARGPSFFQADLRLGYRIKLGGNGVRHVDAFADVFNVTNRANFDNPQGDRRSTAFLLLTTLRPGAAPRTFQLGARIAF